MYDSIVIGNDISSLIAAITSAHHGKKTVLLSKGNIPDIYKESGYTFNVDPMPPSGFGPDQISSRFLAEYGILPANDTNIQVLNPALQMILDDHRIDLFRDSNDFIGELEREFPDDGMKIRDFYQSLLKISGIIDAWIKNNIYIIPKNYNHVRTHLRKASEIVKVRLSLSKTLRLLQKYPSLKKIFEAEINFLSNLNINGDSFIPLISPYILSLPHRGLYYHTGGKGLLMEALRKGFSDAGGQFVTYESITRIVFRDEIEVEINGYEPISQIRGNKLIISTKTEIFSHLLFSNKKFKRLERCFKRCEKRYYPFTLYMGILNKGIPEKMSPYVLIIVEEKRNIMDSNIVYLETSKPDDIRRAPAGKRALSATVFLEDSPLCLSSIELEEKSKIIIGHLETFLPFLRENLDYLNVEMSIDLSRKYQQMINQKYKIKADKFFGITTLSNKTPLKNVYLTGGILMAGLGFEGEVISGINAAFSTIR
jgi:phytoene dehydrogenase-like protein